MVWAGPQPPRARRAQGIERAPLKEFERLAVSSLRSAPSRENRPGPRSPRSIRGQRLHSVSIGATSALGAFESADVRWLMPFSNVHVERADPKLAVAAKKAGPSPRRWAAYYRCTAARPPRELLLRALDHIDWEGKSRRRRTAIDLGFGAGTDTLELLQRAWLVLAIDGQKDAVEVLARRAPARLQPFLTSLIAPMEGLELPPADLIYASYSLPFCSPEKFPALWASIRRALRPGGHFAGQLFGDGDAWCGQRAMSFHNMREVRSLIRGYKVELLRETVEEGQSFDGPKHWHFYDLILEKPRRN
jgi:tellurite methyltransferase